MTCMGLVEMFEGDFEDTCADNFLLVLMGGQAEGPACANPGARTPIEASRNLATYIITITFSIFPEIDLNFSAFLPTYSPLYALATIPIHYKYTEHM
jgi:hypothetical protein